MHQVPPRDRREGDRGLSRGSRGGDEVEFLTLLWFESMDAIRTLAGPDHEIAVVPEDARRLLSRFDARSRHYESLLAPDDLLP